MAIFSKLTTVQTGVSAGALVFVLIWLFFQIRRRRRKMLTIEKSYDLVTLKAPKVSGVVLQILSYLATSPIGALLIPKFQSDAGLNLVLKTEIHEEPTMFPHPLHKPQSNDEGEEDQKQSTLEDLLDDTTPSKGFSFPTIRDYIKAYQTGETTPTEVVRKFIQAVNDSNNVKRPALRAFIFVDEKDVFEQARASTQRYVTGKPLGILDGVPIGVKDEVDVKGYRTCVGTSWIGKGEKCKKDAEVVKRLRDLGAIIVGKTNMHEIGVNVTGCNPNPQHGTARNPYNLLYDTAGSSSGSGAAVASGLCPVAIGCDGGGSIRLPAAFNGVVGLKANFARTSEVGAAPLCPSVGHIGPLAATARDAALIYAIISGEDPECPRSTLQPKISLKGIDKMRDLSDIKIGIFDKWFRDADAKVVVPCQEMVNRFVELGAQTVQISLSGMRLMNVAHVITILSEMRSYLDMVGVEDHMGEMSYSSRIMLAVAKNLSARHYIQSQRVRTHAIKQVEEAFQQVDVIITPASACGVPSYPKVWREMESNGGQTSLIMRYAWLANLTGHPAITFPVAYEKASKTPIALQVIGKYWDEQTLLRLAEAANLIVNRKKPETFYNLLPHLDV